MPRRKTVAAPEVSPPAVDADGEVGIDEGGVRDAFYRVPLSTAEAEATLAVLGAVADLLDGWGEEGGPLAHEVDALRVSPGLLRSASERVRAEMPDFLGVRADREAHSLLALFAALHADAPERSKRRMLEAARDAGSAVEIEYYVPSRGEVTRRTVEVRGVFDEKSGAYLSGYCLLRQDQRMFKLENIRSVRLIENEDGGTDPFGD